jgi:hypothetical protein
MVWVSNLTEHPVFHLANLFLWLSGLRLSGSRDCNHRMVTSFLALHGNFMLSCFPPIQVSVTGTTLFTPLSIENPADQDLQRVQISVPFQAAHQGTVAAESTQCRCKNWHQYLLSRVKSSQRFECSPLDRGSVSNEPQAPCIYTGA